MHPASHMLADSPDLILNLVLVVWWLVALVAGGLSDVSDVCCVVVPVLYPSDS
jgi:hypothetical protein